jgi:hypothetical protein
MFGYIVAPLGGCMLHCTLPINNPPCFKILFSKFSFRSSPHRNRAQIFIWLAFARDPWGPSRKTATPVPPAKTTIQVLHCRLQAAAVPSKLPAHPVSSEDPHIPDAVPKQYPEPRKLKLQVFYMGGCTQVHLHVQSTSALEPHPRHRHYKGLCVAGPRPRDTIRTTTTWQKKTINLQTTTFQSRML